jgi:hypothetical protein
MNGLQLKDVLSGFPCVDNGIGDCDVLVTGILFIISDSNSDGIHCTASKNVGFRCDIRAGDDAIIVTDS